MNGIGPDDIKIKELLARIRVAFRSTTMGDKPNNTFLLDNLKL